MTEAYPYMGVFRNEEEYKQWLIDTQAEADEYEMSLPVEPIR